MKKFEINVQVACFMREFIGCLLLVISSYGHNNMLIVMLIHIYMFKYYSSNFLLGLKYYV